MKDDSKYDWITIQDDEKVLLWEHPHIIPPLVSIIGAMVSALFGLVLILFDPFGLVETSPGTFIKFAQMGAGAFLIISAVIIASTNTIRWVTTHYIITSKRIIKKKGIIQIDPVEKDWSDIDSIDPVQGNLSDGILSAISERIFKYGDMDIASDSGNDIHLENVASYSDYHEKISRQNSMNSIREVIAHHSDKEVEGMSEE